MGGPGLTVDQMLWRRSQMQEMAKTGIPFAQEYPEDLESCFVARGDSYFASPDGEDHLKHYRSGVMDPLKYRESLPYGGSEVSFFGPNLRIWEVPRVGHPYVGYLDCAGGGLDESSDFTVLAVLNALHLHHVATLRLKCAPDEVAPMVCAVMWYYNKGLLGGERDAYGSTALGKIRELQYPSLWYYVDPTKGKEKIVKPWAHPTQTRNRILTGFREEVFTHSFTTRDKQLTLEMGAFTWQKARSNRENVKAAGKGQKDDEVIAAAGCCFIADAHAATYRRQRQEEREATLVIGPGGLVIGKEGPGENETPWFR